MDSSERSFETLLQSALSANTVAALLTSLPSGCGSDATWQARLLKLVPGRRATIEFACENTRDRPVRLIGKLYRSHRRAYRMHQQVASLASVFANAGPLKVPSVRAFNAEAHLVLLDHVPGEDLRHSTHQQEPFRLSAGWLARLHNSSIRPLTKERPADHERRAALRWLVNLEPHLEATLHAELGWRLNAIHDVHSSLELRPVHHDFYYANILWDGATLAAIDFDQMRMGDPALDVGHFVGHLRVLAYRAGGDTTAYSGLEDAFLTSYTTLRPDIDIVRRVPTYIAHTLLKLASTEVGRARPGWQKLASDMALLALEELRQARRQAAL